MAGRIGDDAENRHAGAALEKVEARLKEGTIAAKLVDNEPGDSSSLSRLKQLERADQRCEHAAPVDVADQQHRRISERGNAHVDDLVGLQVDFGRAPGSFDDNQVVGGTQPIERLGDYFKQLSLVALIVSSAESRPRPAADDNLRAHLSFGFQQDWIHVDGGLDARCCRLLRLSAANLATVHGNRRVERHILRLERSDPQPILPEDPAERGDQRTLADRGSGALHHQRSRRHQPLRTISR
ncbi:MAG: hypothetical protein KatS3mg060_2752 [Dehalococcoidia bacterium]|nr:MAG: hypothetical protein KatS3mg060_2752 [Dehalococcoidia bacterium]